MDNIDLYELVFNEDKTLGVLGISLVEEPAMEENFIQFSKEVEVSFKQDPTEERVLTGPILVPNRLVFRKDINGKPANVFLTKETISKLQKNFFKKGYQFNSTIGHSDKIEGVYFFESWIVRNPKNDTATELGFDVPEGTLIMSMKVDNDEVWNNYVKTGKVKGFSIDAILEHLKVENNDEKNNNVKMNREMLSKIIAESIKSVSLAAELKEFIAEDGISYFAEDLALDMIVTDKDGAIIPNANFTYEGKFYVTDENGVIISIEDAQVEESEDAQEDAVPMADATVDPVIDQTQVDPSIEEVDKDAKIAELEAKNMELEAEIVKLKEELVLVKEQNVSMSAQTPASIGIIDAQIANETEQATGLLATLRKLSKK